MAVDTSFKSNWKHFGVRMLKRAGQPHITQKQHLYLWHNKKLVMKKILFSLLVLATVSAHAQTDDIKPAAKGVVYGEALTAQGAAISTAELQARLANNAFEGKVTGKVKEVCKSMGCWMTLEKADGTTLMVKTKDHGFFMPQNLVGKTVVIEGTASVTEVSEAKRKHLAEDAGKGKAEIKKIKGSQKEVQFIASGVEVLD